MNDMTELLPHVKLRFNIEHPSIEECYVYGYECGKAEISEEENPYRAGSIENEHWLEGWWAGFYNDEPLFKLDDVEKIENDLAANDQLFSDSMKGFIIKVIEITCVIAVSAAVGYQMMELVA